jgi:hypothetical protein
MKTIRKGFAGKGWNYEAGGDYPGEFSKEQSCTLEGILT